MIHYHSYYKGFNEEQFAADEYFQQWVLSPDSHTNDFWQSYLNLYAGDVSTIIRARQLVKELADDTNTFQPLSANEKAELRQSIFQRLQLDETTGIINPGYGKKTYRLLAAASVIAVAALSAFVLFKPAKKKEELAQSLFTTVASEQETKEIILPDSSVVILNAGSSLKYKNNFFEQADREVYLDGNAFFKITKHPEHKQFIVHAKAIDITVLGTQFNVNARTGAPYIGLTSGKVKVTRPNSEDAAYMVPGEKIKLDTVSQELVKTTLNTRLYSAWTEHKWNFRQTELKDIAELMGEYYGVTVDFKKERLKNLQITAVIPVTTLESLENILSKTLHVDIQQTNNRLTIQ